MSGPIRFDLASVSSGFEVQEPGDYPGVIVAAKRDVTGEKAKAPGTPKVVFQVKLADGAGSVFDHVPFQQSTLWKLKMWLTAAGIPEDELNQELDHDGLYDLTDRTLQSEVVATLGVRPAQGQYAASNTISRVVAASEALVSADAGAGW